MVKMNASVVTSFDEPPHYQEFDVPQPTNDDEVLVDVLAVGLHPRTRSGASGAHYTSTGRLPMIPGIDGVGQRPDGKKILLRPRRRCARHDGRQGCGRCAALDRVARRCRCGEGGGGPQPRHVIMGGAAPASPDRARPERARPGRNW